MTEACERTGPCERLVVVEQEVRFMTDKMDEVVQVHRECSRRMNRTLDRLEALPEKKTSDMSAKAMLALIAAITVLGHVVTALLPFIRAKAGF